MQFAKSPEACPHSWDESAMVTPRHDAVVHRDECAYCCRTCRHGAGTFVCMGCFAGVCAAHVEKHLQLHPTHAMFTRVRELPEEKKEEVRDVNYLGVVAPKVYETDVCCGVCQLVFDAVPDLAVSSYTSILNAPVPGVGDSSQDKGGYFQKPQCPHLVCLEQGANPYVNGPPTSEDPCLVDGCGNTANNWMCVTCGAIGCPRPEAGGKAHARAHFEATGHPASVKLGTVTPQGADYYCYACDDDVEDVHFTAHMSHFGIDVHTAKKTAKTMGELEYDYTSQFDFNKITEAGADLEPLHGPGYTGIENIGNSCYVASVVQCLMRLRPFQDAFTTAAHRAQCSANPYNCHHCQTERLGDGLQSGLFSGSEEGTQQFVCPRLFKKVVAQRHPEFSTGSQQDAQEYLLYLLEELRRHVPLMRGPIPHPADIMEAVVETRVECAQCHKVRYAYQKEGCLSLPIPVDPSVMSQAEQSGVKLTEAEMDAQRPRCTLEECLKAFTTSGNVECTCQACGKPTTYLGTTRLASFPDVLPVFIRRAYFDASAMTTKKLDAYVDVPAEVNLEGYRGGGLQAGEEEMPENAAGASSLSTEGSAEAPVDEMALTMLVSMGLEADVSSYALRQTNMDVERAVDYIYSRPDIQEEMQRAAAGAKAETPQAGKPAAATDGAASYELVAMISHMGASAKTGHYVCHIRDAESGQWALFNDEKVGRSQNPPFSMASIYFFKRKN